MGGTLCKQSCADFCNLYCSADNNSSDSHLPWFSDVEVDWNGCRKFPRLPPPGQHPRLFFTKDELPRIMARFTHSEIGPDLKSMLYHARKLFLEYFMQVQQLSPEQLKEPIEKSVVDQFFTEDDMRNANILAAYAYGVIYDDPEVAQKAKDAAVFYAKVILRSREIAVDEKVMCKPYKVWHSNSWDLQVGWLFGGHCFAFLYDLAYHDFELEHREIVRNAIASAVKGRRGWGMGLPCRRIQSNWAPYHSDLYIMNQAIEGEEGYDHEVSELFSDLMVHYLDYAFYESGHPIEDSYALNVGFREGSLVLLVMARGGHNAINHPHFKKMWTKWIPYAAEPQNDGRIYGGSSGSNWVFPTCVIIAKYVFPKDPFIDDIYRHFISEGGKKYSRLSKIQTRITALAFAIPTNRPLLEQPAKSHMQNLPLDFVCRDRGKVIMRSDWSENALWFNFDARADGFLIGHDTCSRGAFVLNANGRNWGFCPEWKLFKDSSDFSIPSIDGTGQKDKAPFVKLLRVATGGACGSTFVSADLTYAYNWTWTSWAKEREDYGAKGYEQEPNDPRDFGYNVWWSPNKIFDERSVGFVGLYQWRKRIADVKHVLRSTVFVRAIRPYVIVADNIKKDNEHHDYSWAMTTPTDVRLESFDGKNAILEESSDPGRRFLIRSIGPEDTVLTCSFREIAKLNKKINNHEKAHQIVFSCSAVQACFKFMLFSLPRHNSLAPETTWDENSTILTVVDTETGESQAISFGNGNDGETTMEVAA